ncbi:MAG: exodeoxyribonuclease VII large subunit [Fusobacteriota bacterium]
MNKTIYSVSQLNKEVKRYLEKNPNFQEFNLKGEISNITYYKSGHLYFTLKDESASVKCAAFQYKYKNVPTDLEEGEEVNLVGKISLYERNGKYQVIVKSIERQNKQGLLYAKMERLKKKLKKAGYFDDKHKKKLPKLPLNIGVITSGTGAAVKDIINTARNRFSNINIYVYPSKVQGDGAKEEITKGIKTLNKIEEIDVIIVGRGGGSIEDLWAFNEKLVVDAIYKSEKPIVSAVGHEIDFLISDFISDIRAATPTHASEIVVPIKKELIKQLDEREKKLKNDITKRLDMAKLELKQRQETYILKNYESILEAKSGLLVEKEEKIEKEFYNLIKKYKHKLELREGKLKSLDPLNILNRGYSITTINGRTIKKLKDVNPKDLITTKVSDGEFTSKVEVISSEK